MKKAYFSRIAFVALALTLITTCLMSGTLARYTSTVSGNGTASVAAWSFKANGETASMANVALTDTTLNSKVTTGKIAPGTDGSFDVSLDGSGSDVTIDYVIKIDDITNKPANLKFYTDSAFSEELNLTTGLTGSIALNALATPVVKTVYWQWVYGSEVVDNGDAGKAMTFTISVTGTQSDPT